ALREEGDCTHGCRYCFVQKFLPTPSARRATMVDDFILETWTISTHALREEGDLGGVDDDAIDGISTHALREEGDPKAAVSSLPGPHFYPRPPRGGRPRSEERRVGKECRSRGACDD